MSKTQAAIVGIGESRVGSVPDRSALQLQADAAQAALQALKDAGSLSRNSAEILDRTLAG